MRQGSDIDILTGDPIQKKRDEKKGAFEAGNEKSLKQKAEYLNIAETEGTREMIVMIEKLLEKRIQKFIKDDPEAKAYHQILTTVGYKVNQARKAIEELYIKNYKL